MTVIITGVARPGQAGAALARHFAERGDRVLLLARDGAAVEARAAELRAAGHEARAVAVDLADAAALAPVAAELAANGVGARALVHAAGGFAMDGPVAGSDPALLERMLAVNLVTAFTATGAFLPALRLGRGAIVYFGSAAALAGASAPRMAAYAAAKAGVLALMRAVAAEERPHGVRANAVAPTTIRTAANEAAMGHGPRYVEREALAGVVHWLCSEAARDVTGEVVRLEGRGTGDGGRGEE